MALAVLYLLLAIRQQPACWLAGALSAVLYAFVLAEADLYMEAALQGFYVAMAGYGFWQWRHGGGGGTLAVTRSSWQQHVALLAVVALVTLAAGSLLARYTAAALPFIDSAIAFASLAATWLTARKWLSNWFWWFAIDAASVGVYVERGLYATAALFGLYLVLIIVGYRAWRRTLLPAT